MWQVLKRWQALGEKDVTRAAQTTSHIGNLAAYAHKYFEKYYYHNKCANPSSRVYEFCLDIRHLRDTKFQIEILKLELEKFEGLFATHIQ